MTTSDQRPTEVDRRECVGDGEGGLIIGLGFVTATLRKRVAQFGLVVDLPAGLVAALAAGLSRALADGSRRCCFGPALLVGR